MKALIYLRVSTEDQAERGYSIQAQRTECMSKAAELGCGMENVRIFSDEGVSGAILERPQLMEALDMLKEEKGQVSFFICYDSSRLSRNAAHQLIIVDEIRKCGVQLVFIKNSFQDNAEGRFQLTVMAAVDEYERARLRLRTEMGKRTKANQHKLTHNPGLYGYDFDSKTDTLNINKEQAETLKVMFRLLTEEFKGPVEIADILNEADIPSPRLKLWNRVTVRRILSNPSYLGILYIRRYDTRDCHLNKYKARNEKIKVREKPKAEWIPVQIPQLIDGAVWEKAQNLLKGSKRLLKKNDNAQFLLGSVLKCGSCGRAMYGKNTEKNGRSYRYYICSGKYNSAAGEKCGAASIRADEIEKQVWQLMYEKIICYAKNNLDRQELINSFESGKESADKNINTKKEKAKVERERIITMFQKGYINEGEMSKRIDDLEKLLAKLELAATKSNITEIGLEKAYETESLKENLPIIIEKTLDKLSTEDKKLVLEYLISEITVQDKTLLLSLKA